jgi:hypothetical protein
MNEYLNPDMLKAIDSVDLNEEDREVVRQILMMEKREKNNAAAKNELVNADITLIEQRVSKEIEQ